jgi:transposase
MDSVLLMIRSNFLSAANRLELERCLRRHREEYGIARRANAILLLDKGKPCAEIAEFLYLDGDTIRSWTRSFDRRVGMLLRMTAGRVGNHA